MSVAPTLRTSWGSLPPEGAAAPAAWRSQFRGPCGWGMRSAIRPQRIAAPAFPRSCGMDADASTLPASFFDPLFAATSRAFSWTVS